MTKAIPIADVTKVEMRYSPRAKVIALIMIPIPFFLLLLGNDVISLLLIGMIIVWSVIRCLMVFLTWYQVDDEGIREHDSLQRKRFIQWGEIERIDRTIMLMIGESYKLVLKDRAKGTVSIPTGMTGSWTFAILAKRHLPEEIWKGAFDG